MIEAVENVITLLQQSITELVNTNEIIKTFGWLWIIGLGIGLLIASLYGDSSR